MTRARWIWAMVPALLVGAACADQPTDAPVGSGRLVVQLATPHGDDEALLFEISGPVDSVSAAGSLQLFTRRLDGTTLLGAVIGSLDNGAILTLHVPQGNGAALYTVTVLEVADHEDALRPSLSDYALTVR